MMNIEYQKHLQDVKYAAGISRRYHQNLEWRWGLVDKVVRIAIAFFAVLDVVALLSKYETAGAVAAFTSLALALTLNIVPFGERQLFHADLFRRWGDLRKEADSQLLKLGGRDSQATMNSDAIERLREIAETENGLHAAEPAPWPKLLKKCQEDENESIFGEGLRTSHDIETERAKRMRFVSKA